ncbi:hypothetical protein [uncultured Victivallis sp.]|uniref:hypothetical protein n=1 Tax=uncultured Victivallis sp. TaxID=354118 RepID=UPI0025F8CCD4|nr:hypothetical protein [uncultured Victivallis sp.]
MNSIQKWLSSVFLAGSALFAAASAEAPAVKAPVTRVALFKNGYALVVREVASAPADRFLLDESIVPIHGTLWFAPGDGLSVTGVSRSGKIPNRNPFADLTASYENLDVTVTLKSSGSEASRIITGTLVRLGEPPSAVPPLPQQPSVWHGGRSPGETAAQGTGFLAVRQKDGCLVTFRASEVASIESTGINSEIREQKRMLLVNRAGMAGKPLVFSYLAHGLTWAPAYRIALGPEAKLRIDQSATIINDLEDLKDAEISFVSGFPNLQYAGVASPLASGMTFQTFSQQLNQMEYARLNGQPCVLGQVVMKNSFARNETAAVSPLPESGASEDIHFTSGGKVSLAKGDVSYRTLAEATADYERLVEWEIPDWRNEWGVLERNFNRPNGDGNPDGDLWDAVRFRNPFPSPITSAPIEIVDGEKLLGQSTIQWVNPGDDALVRITKALTVSGNRIETEVPGKRELITIGGWNYRCPVVEGTVTLRNFRSNAAKVVVKLRFSGELLSADGSPKSRLLETGVYSVNPRRELVWELTLEPRKEVALPYRYRVLVRD